jgi:hypothetical protein
MIFVRILQVATREGWGEMFSLNTEVYVREVIVQGVDVQGTYALGSLAITKNKGNSEITITT